MFHWNVEGSDFAQLHEFFGNVYQEVFDSVEADSREIEELNNEQDN
jgi:DNA-binding ferritin-like protein